MRTFSDSTQDASRVRQEVRLPRELDRQDPINGSRAHRPLLKQQLAGIVHRAHQIGRIYTEQHATQKRKFVDRTSVQALVARKQRFRPAEAAGLQYALRHLARGESLKQARDYTGFESSINPAEHYWQDACATMPADFVRKLETHCATIEDGGFMHWIQLLFAIVFEVAGTTCMKLSSGFSRWVPSALMIVFYVASFSCLTLALRRIEVSVAYAIWSGVGVALIAAIGMVFFRESASVLKFIGLAAIIFGVLVLRIAGGTSE